MVGGRQRRRRGARWRSCDSSASSTGPPRRIAWRPCGKRRHPRPDRTARGTGARTTGNSASAACEDAKLLTVNREEGSGVLVALDAHPLLREYFARQLRAATARRLARGAPAALRHLCATTKDKPQPTLEDLQPLYQAVAHGCQAGLQQEACDKVYRDRILRGQRILQHEETRRVRFRLGSRRLLLRAHRGAASRPRSRKPTKPGC